MKSSPKHSNPNYKSNYPGLGAYHFPEGKTHLSPCMNPFWRSQPIRVSPIREEWDFEEKPDNEEDQ
jgi:hypothetical protein